MNNPAQTLAAPFRIHAAHQVRLIPAASSGAAAGLAALAVYYATLGLLPPATAYPTTTLPVSAWAHRFDLAQFAGTLLHPPYPTLLTWELGLAVLFGTFVALGVVYAILLAWASQSSDTRKGAGFGVAVGLGLLLLLTVANGLHPAIMRNALPDTGLALLGWSFGATLQLLLVHAVYGVVLGRLYRHGSQSKKGLA